MQAAFAELQAECIAVPPCDMQYLLQGFALHFRCQHPDAKGMRVDVMSVMRGLEDFSKLWERRTTLSEDNGLTFELLSLPDLVRAKKTQRSKDWPMIQRLVEADYFHNSQNASEEQRRFWLLELRTPDLLIELAEKYRSQCVELVSTRPLLSSALQRNADALRTNLEEEEKREREDDFRYWLPLKTGLEKMRRERLKTGPI